MKRILLYSVLLFANCFFVRSATGQNSCSQFVLDSFRLNTDPNNNCNRSIYVCYTDPANGAKSSRIIAICGGTDTVFNICYNTSNINQNKNNTLCLTTPIFQCCNLSTLKIVLAAYTGDTTCHGTPCYTLISVGGGALPVYFKNFSATRTGEAITLQWSTASEENNKGFEVDRKTGLGDWVPITFVNSAAPGGNSLADLNYSFTDRSNINESSFYLLKQVDLDGQFSYSPIREVPGLRSNGLNISIYPNPGRNGQTTVFFADVSQSYNLVLTDAMGRMMRQWSEVHGSYFHFTGLVPGWYNLLIIAKGSGKQTVEKFVIWR